MTARQLDYLEEILTYFEGLIDQADESSKWGYSIRIDKEDGQILKTKIAQIRKGVTKERKEKRV